MPRNIAKISSRVIPRAINANRKGRSASFAHPCDQRRWKHLDEMKRGEACAVPVEESALVRPLDTHGSPPMPMWSLMCFHAAKAQGVNSKMIVTGERMSGG